MEAKPKLKLPRTAKITPTQWMAIVNAADNLSAMLGCGDDDTDFKSCVKGIDSFLKANGLKRKYN